ncbi:MAG: hypothetical protein V1750_07005, partial [Acidobacteriota bacterium]
EAVAAGAQWPAAAWDEVELAAPAGGAAGLPSARLLLAAARRALAGESPASLAAGFHATFCRLAVELTVRAIPAQIKVVALGGGCLANRLLRAGLGAGLREVGLAPLLPAAVPPGDGGLAYGQVVIGVMAAARGEAQHFLGG